MPKGCVSRAVHMSMYGECGAAALLPATLTPVMGHPLRHMGDSELPSASPLQSLGRAGVLAHLPRDSQIWGRGFSLINRLQLIVLSGKVV